MHHYLNSLFRPASVAVVGVSAREERPANGVIKGLIDGGFKGRVYAVGSGTGHASLDRSYPTVDDLPEAPDVVFSAVSAARTPEVMLAAARKGVRFGIVFTAGFAEMSEQGSAREAEMVRACRELGMRIVGPNCMGVFDSTARANISEVETYPSGRIALVTQSGNIALSLFNDAPRFGLGFSSFVSFGNQADIPIADYVEYLGEDAHSDAVVLYIESMADGHGPAFVDACRRVSRRKPVVVLKGGRTGAGRRAAESHTARLSPAAEIFSAAFRQGGVVEVQRLDEVLPVVETLLRCPPLRGPGIAVVGSGGGHSTIATDALEQRGLEIPEFGADIQSAISEHLPEWAPKGNPIDMTGLFIDDLQLFSELMSIATRNATAEGVLAYGLYGGTWNPDIVDVRGDDYLSAAGQFADFQTRTGLPVVFFSPFADWDNPVFTRMRGSGVPCFNSVETAAEALRALHRRTRLLARDEAAPQFEQKAPEHAARIDGVLSEYESLRVVSGVGVPVVLQELSGLDEDAVLLAAERIGYPVVLKADLPGVAHKSDLGAVAVGIRSPEDLRSARERITRSVEDVVGRGGITGFTVSQHVSGRRELMLGARRDPIFGTVVVLGLGGVTVELARRSTVMVAPVSTDDIALALEDDGLAELLGEWRGEPEIRLRDVAQIVSSLHALMLNDPSILSVDLNPMLVHDGELIAVDAAIERSSEERIDPSTAELVDAQRGRTTDE